MIFPKVTDGDEWNYLETLQDQDLIGYPNSEDYDYYACILRHKYPHCQTVKLTATTFQVLQPDISVVPVRLTLGQRVRKQLFDVLDSHFQGNVSKKEWLEILAEENLLPTR